MNSIRTQETLGRESARPSHFARRSLFPAILFFCSLAWLWFFLCRQLSYEWSANEQYNYGWFVPFFALFLFWLRWEDFEGASAVSSESQPAPSLSRKLGRESAHTSMAVFWLLVLLLVLLPVRLFEVANPDWRPLSWAHALAVVGYSLLVIGYWGGKRAVRHFAFPVCFILVAVPWITPIEGPLVQGLMKLVAAIATETLTLFGIPAQLEGSLIRINNGVVGVSEACSGVRSLQTSLMIGLLFGELKRLSLGRRVALVGTALAIALVMNFGRAFFLVWTAATQNLAAVERWHDIAGYAIVGAVFFGTVGVASALGRAEGRAPARPGHAEACPCGLRLPPTLFLLSTFAFLLLSEASVSAWYRWHERNFVERPRWTVHWPESARGFRELPIDDNVKSTLRYDAGREGAWQIALTNSPNDRSGLAKVTMFFFRWDPGSPSILRARAHRPDICLPNTGWRVAHDDGVRLYAVSPGFSLPFRHFRFVREAGEGRRIFAQAFFCQREDRVPRGPADRFDATLGATGNWTRNDRLRVVREGLRNQGQQVLELVMMTPNEMKSGAAEEAFAGMLPRLITTK